MPLSTRTFDEAYQLARSLLRNYIDGADVSEGSDYDITARILAALFVGNQGQAQFLADQIFADSAEGDFLDRHLKRVGGRLSATKGSGTIQITAPSGSDILPSGSSLTHVSGTTFVTTAAATITLPAFSSKTVVKGSNQYRLFLSPDVTGMAAGDQLLINSEVRTIQGVDTNTGAVDLHEPLSSDPASGTSVDPQRGATVPVEASATGKDGNKPQGDVLTIDSPPGVIEAEARIILLSGGDAEEEDDAARARVVAHDEQPPGNGNAAHYRSAARRATTVRVADALIYPGFRGLGTTDIIPVGPSGARFPTDVMVSTVDTILGDDDEGAPYPDDYLVTAGTQGAYREVSVSVLYETGFEPDFDFTGAAGFSVAAAGSTTTRLEIGADPTATSDIEVGDRILYSARFGGTWQVYERTVAGLGATFIDVSVALPFTPALNPDARADVYSSGPLGLATVAAIEGVYDALGWGTGLSGGDIFERFPRPSDELDPVLRLNAIRCAVKALDGVRDCIIDTLDDTTPADIVPAAQTRIRQGQITILFVEP